METVHPLFVAINTRSPEIPVTAFPDFTPEFTLTKAPVVSLNRVLQVELTVLPSHTPVLAAKSGIVAHGHDDGLLTFMATLHDPFSEVMVISWVIGIPVTNPNP
jgi:hypothetical protein